MKNRLIALVLPLALAVPAFAAQQVTPPQTPDGLQPPAELHAGIESRFGQRGRHDDVHVARGYYQTITEQIWVEGVTRRVWVPEQYRTVYDFCGRAHNVLVRAGYYRTICEPGHFETVTRRVWVPARPVITPGRGIDRGHGRGEHGRRGGRH
ncbi:MAG: hypothetical protein H6830_03870 [Planctomycetes bacterium]|nr:hypothetical protein [Planctomycetota bacterium]